MGWHMFGNYGSFDGGWMILGGLTMLLFPILFIVFIVWLVFALISKEGSKDGQEMHIAKERYAKGELKKDEYEEMIKTLKKEDSK